MTDANRSRPTITRLHRSRSPVGLALRASIPRGDGGSNRSLRTRLRVVLASILIGATTLIPVLLSACAAPPEPREVHRAPRPSATGLPPVTLEEIIDMSARGLPAAEIIGRLRTRQVISDLTVQDVLLLREARVPDAVIDFVIRPPHLFPRRPPSRSIGAG